MIKGNKAAISAFLPSAASPSSFENEYKEESTEGRRSKTYNSVFLVILLVGQNFPLWFQERQPNMPGFGVSSPQLFSMVIILRI